jgi:LuxR family transcriptional regulator, maltose regulon positive regulatory protein
VYLPTHMTFGEIAELLFVSRNTVKSHAIAIYRKLGVSTRSAAVATARHYRLLPD